MYRNIFKDIDTIAEKDLEHKDEKELKHKDEKDLEHKDEKDLEHKDDNNEIISELVGQIKNLSDIVTELQSKLKEKENAESDS